MTVRLKPLRRAAGLLLIVYWAALFIGTHIPSPVHAFGANDKLLHLGAYAGLSFLMASAFAGSWPRIRILLLAFGIVVGYGALDELSQLPIPGRHGDLWDWLADVSGAALGLLAYFLAWIALRQVLSSTTAASAVSEPSLTTAQGV